MRSVRLVAVALAAELLALTAGAARANAASATPPKWAPGEVIVKFRSDSNAARGGISGMEGVLRHAQSAARIGKVMPGRPQVVLMRFPKNVSVTSIVAKLRTFPEVAYAEPNYIAAIPASSEPDFVDPVTAVDRLYRQASDGSIRSKTFSSEVVEALRHWPNDPEVVVVGNTGQPNWFFMGADEIWPDTATTSAVAVLDTGADYKQPDLVGQITNGKDYVNADTDPTDDNSHGTHVTGIISAKMENLKGIAGISRGKVYSIKVLAAQGLGTYFDIATGIRAAADQSAVRVINMSLGGTSDSPTLHSAVDYAVNTKGKLIVAAAGNTGGNDPIWPAFYANMTTITHANCATSPCPTYPEFQGLAGPKILAVAAQKRLGGGGSIAVDVCRLGASSYGGWVRIAAPGERILSTAPTVETWAGPLPPIPQGCFPNGCYFRNTGTSMATPHVAASAARVWSVFPLSTNDQVAARLLAAGLSMQAAGNMNGTCWPTLANNQGNDVVLLQLPPAMERSIIFGYAMDATAGVGLYGGQVRPYQGTAPKGFTRLIYNGAEGYYEIINVPYNAVPYTLKVSKAGFTSGLQSFATITVGPTARASCAPYGCAEPVTVPRVVFTGVVTDFGTWLGNDDSHNDPYDAPVAFDQFLYLPPNVPAIVGNPLSAPLTTSATFNDVGALGVFPFARLIYDGGYATGNALGDDTAHEATYIKTFQSTTAGPYNVYVRDYAYGCFGTGNRCTDGSPSLPGSDLADVRPVVRVWKGGVVKNTVRFDPHGVTTVNNQCTFQGGLQDCHLWHVGTFVSTGIFTESNIMGDGTIVPYGGSNGPGGTQ